MDKITFSTKGKPDRTVTTEEAQAILNKVYNNDTVDLFILNIKAGKVASFTLHGIIVEAKLATS